MHRQRLLRLSVALFLLGAPLPACHGFGAGHERSKPARPISPKLVASLPPQSSVRRIGSRADVHLTGWRVDARPGDWLLEGAGVIAVVSATKGTVVDFGVAGSDDGMVSLDTNVFLGLDEPKTVVESVGPTEGARAIVVQRRIVADPPLRLATTIYVGQGALVLESTATATGASVLAATVGEIVGWGNERTWIEGHGFITDDRSYTGDFIAREAFGIAYALAPLDGHVLARCPKPEVGYNKAPRTGERVETIPAQGQSHRRVITLTAARGSMSDAVRALPRYANARLHQVVLPGGLPAGTFAEIARCDETPFEQTLATAEPIVLPHGCWKIRLAAPGHAPGVWATADVLDQREARPSAGTLRWRVRARDDRNGPLPARIAVHGVDGSSDPDWGDDANDGAALDVIHVDRDGERPIPPGHYRVNVTRGFEYTAFDAAIDVRPDRTVEIDPVLDRVVDTPGWISADLHVHSIGSMDAPTPLSDRVVALAAAGVEVAVATDHNAVTDYSGAIAERHLGRWLTSMSGDELSTRGVLMGHFNVFPLAPGSEPPPYESLAPSVLVARARAAPPSGPKILQINHPRMGDIGYFELLRFDPRDVAHWRSGTSLAETGFDAIEVFNGDDYYKIDDVEQCLNDWYALLDAGIRMTATGNSDSHKITYHEAGTPRNFVAVTDDAPEHLDRAQFIEAIRKAQVVVSSGPLVRLTVDGRGPGESVAPGEHDVVLTVDAPPWVDVTAVDLISHGKKLRSFGVPRSTKVRRFETHFRQTLAHGDWLVAVARGERPMEFLYRSGALPFAFTNPVWTD